LHKQKSEVLKNDFMRRQESDLHEDMEFNRESMKNYDVDQIEEEASK
jgi:hypothetical protein